MSKNTFHFFAEASNIVKAKDKNNRDIMRLGGTASTMDEDSDGEFLDPNGFDVSYLEKSGFVNWHHGTKENPSTIIGEPSKVNLTNKGLEIEVDLYANSALAKQVYDLAQVLEQNSTSRGLGFSIEGKAIERDLTNPKIIKKARITGVAITHMPKNHKTFANIIKGEIDDFEQDGEELLLKSLEDQLTEAKIALADQILKSKVVETDGEDDEDTEKSLTTETGAALVKEHVDGQEKKLTKAEIYAGIFDMYPEIKIEKAKKVFNIIQKLSEMKSNHTTPSVEEIKKAMDVLNILDSVQEHENELEKAKKAETEEDDSDDDTENEDNTENEGSSNDDSEDDSDDDDEGEKENNFKKSETEIFLKGENDLYRKGTIENNEFKPSSPQLYEKTDGNFIKKAMEDANTDEIIKKAISVVEGKFADILQKQTETIDTLKGELEAVVNQRNGRKSFKSVNQIEKSFSNGEDGIEKAGGTDGRIISISRNRGLVTQMLEKAVFSDINKGISTKLNPVLEKAITVFETSGQLPADIRRMIETQENIVLQA